MHLLKHFKTYDLMPLVSILLVCLFPCVFIYTQNAQTAALTDTFGVFGLYVALAAIVTAISLIFFRNFSRAALFADAVMLVVINFNMLSGSLQRRFLWYSPVYLGILLVIILLTLLILLLRKKPDLRIACTLVTIAFASVTIMNLALAVPTIIKASAPKQPLVMETTPPAAPSYMPSATPAPEALRPEASVEESESAEAPAEVPPEPVEADVFTSQERPNVYLFIFDEYGGYENLMHYFGYDNDPFLCQLEDWGFNVSRDSLNTEAVYTKTLLPNLLNMDYVMDAYQDDTVSTYYLDNSYLVRTFLKNGYQVNLADHLDAIGHTGCNVLTENQTAKTISDILVGNSIFSKFDRSEANYYDQVVNVMEAERNCWQYVGNEPTLTIGYLQMPHSPLAFGRDGTPNDRKEYYNWKDDMNYINQLEYITDFILEVVEILQEKDPNALIILQSDHGCRYPIHQIQVGNTDVCDPETEYPHMQNILNCVFYRGETIDIGGQNSINTLRRTFNHVFGTHFEAIEPVYFWTDISQLITRFE